MKSISDLFSDNAGGYQKYRPDYPIEFIEEIISLVQGRDRCWDCGTGNGQVARILSRYFSTVNATDISPDQIKKAYQSRNIHYNVGRAEQSSFPDDHFALITAAQAAHWFDFSHFFKEIARVSKKDGIVALWGYGLLRFDNELDLIIDNLYQRLQSDWNEERRHIEDNYNSIPFPLDNIPLSKSFSIRREFTLEELIGYINTWSGVKNFRMRHHIDPLEEFTEHFSVVWEKNEKRITATFPIFHKTGRVAK